MKSPIGRHEAVERWLRDGGSTPSPYRAACLPEVAHRRRQRTAEPRLVSTSYDRTRSSNGDVHPTSWKVRYSALARQHGLALAQLIFVGPGFTGLEPGRKWAIVEDEEIVSAARAMKIQLFGANGEEVPATYDAELRPILVIHDVR